MIRAKCPPIIFPANLRVKEIGLISIAIISIGTTINLIKNVVTKDCIITIDIAIIERSMRILSQVPNTYHYHHNICQVGITQLVLLQQGSSIVLDLTSIILPSQITFKVLGPKGLSLGILPWLISLQKTQQGLNCTQEVRQFYINTYFGFSCLFYIHA